MARDLTTFVAIMLTSIADGEIVQAARQARKLLERDGKSGNDLAQAIATLDDTSKLREQNGKLLAAAKELKAEVDRLKRQQRPVISNLWAATGSPQAQATWALQLHADGVIPLSEFDGDFLATIAAWDGEITVKQRPILERILTRIAQRTGRQPP